MKYYSNVLIFACLAHFLSFSVVAQAQELTRNPFQEPTGIATRMLYTESAAPLSGLMNNSQKLYPLSYAQADELAASLKELFSGKIGVDKSTNSLILYGPDTEHQRMQKLLHSLDIATKQVTLEAKIIALSQEHNKSLGINWNWDTIPQRDQTSDTETDENADSTSDFGGNFKFWRGYAFRFNATLNALISNGKAKVLAKPRIITIPGREASIFIGDHIPVQTEKHDSGGYYTATEYLDAGIKLQYLDRKSVV